MAAVEDELRPHLDRGEKLIWAGRPAQGVVFTAMDLFLVPFSVVWLGLVVMGYRSVLGMEMTVIIMGVLFTCVGIYIVVGRFVADWLYRSRLIYGVTDRRAMIVSRMLGPSV